MRGGTWWHVEGLRAPELLPGWVRLCLLLSGLVWPLLKSSKTSRSGSVLVQGRGSSFNRSLLSPTPCSGDRQTLGAAVQASSPRNPAITNIGAKRGCLHGGGPQIHLILAGSRPARSAEGHRPEPTRPPVTQPRVLAGGSSPAHPGTCWGHWGRGHGSAAVPLLRWMCPWHKQEPAAIFPGVRRASVPGCSSLTLPGAHAVTLGHGEATGRPPGGAGQADPDLQHVPRPQCIPLPGPLCPHHPPCLLRRVPACQRRRFIWCKQGEGWSSSRARIAPSHPSAAPGLGRGT